MTDRSEIPSLTQPLPRDIHVHGRECKTCKTTLKYVCNGACVVCAKKSIYAKVKNYAPNEADRVLAVTLYTYGESIQTICKKLGCLAVVVHEYLRTYLREVKNDRTV